jgi:hypothetical protein
MIDAGSIAAAIGSLKTAADIAKGFLDLKEAAAVQGRVIELQGVILSAQSSALAAQSEQMTSLDRIRQLERQIAHLEAWDMEKKRYQLAEVAPGLTAYSLKPGMENGEPPHQICASCYNKGHKSPLQVETRYPGMAEVLVCHDCGSELYVHGQRHKDHSGPRRR